MFLNGLGTAVPAQRYTQAECWAGFQAAPQFADLSSRSRAILRKILTGKNGIEARHLGLATVQEGFVIDPDTLHQRFFRHAPDLAAKAAIRAMEQAGIDASAVDALLISTCTGYLCPGLTSYVSERLGLKSGIHCLDLVGQGCGAALPTLSTAAALTASDRANHALCISVEICSAAFYLDEDPGVLVSACLFGDGAAAVVVGREPGPHRRSVRWIAGGSSLRPELRDTLRFEHRGGMLRNLLSPDVPQLAAESALNLFQAVAAREKRERDEIRSWVWHPGGRDVLDAIAERFGLTPADLKYSAAVLRDYGNVSSPCVLFVLDAMLRDGSAPGLWWMSSFGAGFSCHGAFLEVG